MITYINIDRNNNFIYDAQEKVYKKKELLLRFEEFVKTEGFNVAWVNNSKVPYEAIIEKGMKKYTIVLYLKNITGAGWADKPHIKRVQVSNVRNDDMDKYIDTTNDQTILILGYYNFDDNPVIVAWDAYKYVYHNTIRSCYVNTDNLLSAYKSGYVVTECSNQKIWLFRPNNFARFLDEYISSNKIGE